MKRYKSIIVLEKSALSVDNIIDYINQDLGFTAERIRGNFFYRYGAPFVKNDNKVASALLKYDNPLLSITIGSDDNFTYKFDIICGGEYVVIHWTTGIVDVSMKQLFNTLINHDKIVVAYQFDYDFVWMQSADTVTEYEIYRPYTGKLYYNERLDMKMIDISNNPGRIVRTKKGCWIGCSWRMWFGNILSLINEDDLLAFNTAQHIQRNQNNIFVQLYEDPFDSWKTENMQKLEDLRKVINANELEKIC